MRSRFLAVLAAAIWFVLGPAPLQAAPSAPGPAPSALYVLNVATEDADDQARALTIALKRRVRESKEYALGDLDISLQVVTLALKCSDIPNAACQAKIAAKIKADRYFWAVMKRVPSNQVQVDVHLWQANNDVHERFVYSDNLTQPVDPALERIVDQIYERLVNYGKVGAMRIVVDGAPEGELFVDGKSQGRFDQGTRELTLPLGEHRFEIRARDRIVAAGAGVATAGQVTEVTLLSGPRMPAPIGPPAAPPAAPPARDEVQAAEGDRRALGYVALGAGAVLIGAGVYASLKVNAFDSDIGNDPSRALYFSSFAHDQDVCDAARRGVVGQPGAASPRSVATFCGTAPTSLEVLQYIFYGLGALSAGTGVYLTATAKPTTTKPDASAASRVRVTPSAGPSRTSLDLRVTF